MMSLGALAGCSDNLKPKNDLPSLQKEIGVMIQQLGSDKNEDIKNFILRYAAPGDLGEDLEGDRLDKLVASFKNRKRDKLLETLKYVIDKEPVRSDDKVTYTYSVPEGLAPRNTISFYWDTKTSAFYIRDK